MTDFEFGDIVLVPFPFTDQTSSKNRPAVVVSSSTYHCNRPDIVILAITSQLHASSQIGPFLVTDWKTAGLLKPSYETHTHNHPKNIDAEKAWTFS